ncbi:hypothetical protein T4B_7265 [Trichinella pseudospiralis]|uniref:Uncharacterized protein n=1 Tax=Trichinella pseudospiralis TaxID=6337 RepID=A0A0V1GF66_TRIPS|nr:hypothetical protein T4B_7265 [Trichinella pseudospiralis]
MCINISNAKIWGPFIPQPLEQASLYFRKIRKFRENLDFSKVDKMGINRFEITLQFQ